VSFRRAVAANVAVQAIGPASAFLTVLLIARVGGAADQGQYAQLKSWVDLLVAIGCFGFPQGFIYVINRLRASAGALASWSCGYSLAFLPVALGSMLLAQRMHWLGVPGQAPLASVTLLTIAASLLVLHGMWRGVYLTHQSGIPFALFTILPAVTLMIAVTTTTLVGSRRFEWSILLSAIVTVAVASTMMRPILRGRRLALLRHQPWRPLLTNGMHAFAQAMLMTLQPVVAYQFIRVNGGSSQEMGFLNAGAFLVQGLSVPITMVAPLLFARWTSVPDDGLMSRLNAYTLRALAIEAVSGCAIASAARWFVPAILGAGYVGAIAPIQAMLVTAPLVCHMRVVAPALHARGVPVVNTVAFGLRVTTFVAVGFTASRWIPRSVDAAALAWACGEVAAAGWTLVVLNRLSAEAQACAVQASGR
jgi:O-antigen/teichoic acid export membrane protein